MTESKGKVPPRPDWRERDRRDRRVPRWALPVGFWMLVLAGLILLFALGAGRDTTLGAVVYLIALAIAVGVRGAMWVYAAIRKQREERRWRDDEGVFD